MRDMRWELFQASIKATLEASLQKDLEKNAKLQILIDTYSNIQVNTIPRQQSINDFIDNVSKISDNLNSDFWNGEDVMAIFFNEFTRYKGKSEQGQVFTPDHITSLMYRLIEVNKDSVVSDAACGSRAFLVKAMCNMIKESGGVRTKQATAIKDNELFGIEFDMDLYIALFFVSLFRKEDIRYQFLDKWILDKMNETNVLLPCGNDDKPDWKSIRKLVNDIYDKMV